MGKAVVPQERAGAPGTATAEREEFSISSLPTEVAAAREEQVTGAAAAVETVIRPPGRWPGIDWPELWRYRDLFLVFAWRDISVRYKQTVLGVLWAVFQPVISMIVFSFVFNRMAGIKSGDGTPYPIFLYTGLLLWQYYSGVLTNASNSMVSNAGMIQKIYFPRLIIPGTAAVTGLVDTAIASVILGGLMIFYHCHPKPLGLLVLPVLVVIAVLSSLGVGLIFASVNIKYRDVRYALPFFIQIMMYVTPVVYPASLLNHHPWAKVLMTWLNPISAAISSARATLLGRGVFDVRALLIALLMSVVLFLCGLYYFRKTERYFADIV